MIQILGLSGMYFDAEVVFLSNFQFYSVWLQPYCVPLVPLDTFNVENILTSVNVTGEATMNTLMGFDRHFFMPINVH